MRRRGICPTCHREELWGRLVADGTKTRLFSPRIAEEVGQFFQDTKLSHFIDGKKKGLYLYGPVGSGKTILAARLTLLFAKQLFMENEAIEDIHFRSIPEILLSLRSSFSEGNGDYERKLVNELSNCTWLVLDDLGAEKTSEWVLQTLYLIINNRYENMLHTIFTSNLSLDELSEKLGSDRIPSRIAAMCRVVEFAGRDYRIEEEG